MARLPRLYAPGLPQLVQANFIQPLAAPSQPAPADILNQLAPLDTAAKPFNITFVDVFFSYHDLLGEIHCGSNFVRTPPNDDWWNK